MTYPGDFELRYRPVRELRLVEQYDLDVSVGHMLHVERPVVVALLPPLLHAAGQHDDGPAVLLPDHPPEVVSGRVQRALGHDELSGGVVTLKFNGKIADIEFESDKLFDSIIGECWFLCTCTLLVK